MSRFDDALRDALRREDPPEGFAGRVLARAAAKRPAGRWTAWFAAPALRWAATAMAALFLVFGFYYQREARQAEQQRAGLELVQALQIASSKLQVAQDKVYQLSSR